MSDYDPFNLPTPTEEERRLKYFLDSNGLWLDSNEPWLSERCLCACIAGKHLDGHQSVLPLSVYVKALLKKKGLR